MQPGARRIALDLRSTSSEEPLWLAYVCDNHGVQHSELLFLLIINV